MTTRALGIRDEGSLGVCAYVARLAGALQERGVSYEPVARADGHARRHLHFANSSRRVVLDVPRSAPFLLTVHDVLPRTRALSMFQRGLLAVAGGRAARVIVHSGHAASLLRQITGSRPRVEVVPHPATVPFAGRLSRDAARGELGIVPGPPLFVLPGVLKAAKLVPEVLSAAAPLLRDGRLRLALVGAVGDDRLAVAARRAGAAVVSAPDGDTYSRWVVASDAVLCLRRESVGEANGPLLDAIGAGRAVLATDTGCIAEVAGDAARLVVGEPSAIGLGLQSLLDAGERAERERVALARAGALTWAASAEVHADLLAELDRA